MLGCLLARELRMQRIMVPHHPGVVSALGGLVADVKNDFIRTVFVDADRAAFPVLQTALVQLHNQAEHWLRQEQHYAGAAAVSVSADMSYRGQSFEIEVPLDADWIEASEIMALLAAFHRQHAAIYEFADASAPVQILNLRLVIAGAAPLPAFPTIDRAADAPRPERIVSAWYAGESHRVPLYHRDALRHGHTLPSPAIVVQEDATTCIPAGFAVSVDEFGNLHLRLEA
jgi:N-methylhydantoinase A